MINVMISSTIEDLEGDRDACVKALSTFDLFQTVGANQMATTSNSSPYVTTIDIARSCNLYILILGGRYGFSDTSGRSATEIEFDAAYQSDPTKILVFRKQAEQTELKQKKFIQKVSNYRSGYWYNQYKHTHDLLNMTVGAARSWLLSKANMNHSPSVYENFLQLAIQIKPYPDTVVYYKSTETDIEIEYNIFGKLYSSHFEKQEISTDFWGCLHSLQSQIHSWRK